MVEVEKVISRSELFDDEGNNEPSYSEIYTLPPPGFDFEIVDVDDQEGNTQTDEVTDDKEVEEKVELFNMFSSSDNTSNLVKVKVDDFVSDDKNDNIIKYNDEEWDSLVKARNIRPMSYYFQSENDNSKVDDYLKVAVDGQTIHYWSEKFRIISNYKLMNLKEFNSKVNLVYRPKLSKKSTLRKSRKRRDAQIFKKERLKNWKKSLDLIQQRIQTVTSKDYTRKDPVKVVFKENGETRRVIQRSKNNSRSRITI